MSPRHTIFDDAIVESSAAVAANQTTLWRKTTVTAKGFGWPLSEAKRAPVASRGPAAMAYGLQRTVCARLKQTAVAVS